MYDRPQATTNFDDVGTFHTKFGLPSVTSEGAFPRKIPRDLIKFRIKFLLEELVEYASAVGAVFEVDDQGRIGVGFTSDERDLTIDEVTAFDSLLDLVVVAMGTAHLHGYPWQSGWEAVQSANMAKVRAKPDGSNSKRASGWDIVKPEGWKPPDNTIRLLLIRQGFELGGHPQ